MEQDKHTVGAVLSTMTGYMLVHDFGQVHACIEHLAGGPVWTHQIPSVGRAIRPQLRAALPRVAELADDVPADSSDARVAWMRDHETLLQGFVSVPVIGHAPESPFDGLEGKDVVAVVV